MGHHAESDPFAGLEDWAETTERRVRRQRRFGGLRRTASFAAATAVLLGLVVAVVHWWPGSHADSYPKAAVPAGRSVTTSAVPAGPFAGTPAASYPKGVAGITLPPAKAVLGFTAEQVGAALRKVRAALVAGRLAHGMLVDHDPAPFLALLAPNAREPVRKWFRSATFATVATWIDPAVTLDAVEQPGVSGRVTYTSTLVKGVPTLRVTTNFVWVYAFTGIDRSLAAEHDEIRWEFPATLDLRAGDRGMWIAGTRAYSAWVDCAASDRGLLAPTRPEAAPAPRAGEDPNALLKADHSLDIEDDC